MTNKLIYFAISSLFGIVYVSSDFSKHFLIILIILLVLISNKNVKIGISCTVTFMLFSALFYYVDSNNVSKLVGGISTFTGRITSTPIIDGDRLKFNFQLTSGEKLYVTYKIQSEQEKERLTKLKSRTTCHFQGKLNSPNEARNFNSFDFRKYLYWQKIHWVVSPTSFSMGNCKWYQLNTIGSIQYQRDIALDIIKKELPSPLNGFVQALVLGERDLINEDVISAYQELGLIHLLAISGMHVGLICSFVYLVLVRFGMTREKAVLSIFIFLPIYVMLAGSSPSVIRAAIMTFLVLIKIRFRSFPFSLLDLLSVAFMCMILFNPYYVFNVGFQLSFTVSFSLIVSSQTILLKVTNPVQRLIVVSFIAQISSLPLILYHFHQFSILSIILNLIFIPLITLFILPICIILFLLILIKFPFVYIIAQVVNKTLYLLNLIAVYFVDRNGHVLVLGKPNLFLIILYIGVVVFTLASLEKKVKFSLMGFIPLLFILILHWNSPYFDSKGEITVIDVGQGDSFLIELPFRKGVYLIDTGGKFEFNRDNWKQKKRVLKIGENIIIPYLKSKGIRKIDKLILTHPDLDHIGEATYLLRNIEVSEILIGAYNQRNSIEEDVISLAEQKKIRVSRVKAGDYWINTGIEFRILAPFEGYSNKNDGSIVVSTQIGGASWLFTGDIEEKAEEALIKKYPDLKVDVLKIAHHGSKSSSSDAFLEAVEPKIAIISSGLKNRYGHPHQEIVDRLSLRQVFIFRTDQHGAIKFSFLGKQKGTFQTKIPYNTLK